MNKIAKLFVLAGVTFVLACGPKGPSEQEKETMRLDSIAKAEAEAAKATVDTAAAKVGDAAGEAVKAAGDATKAAGDAAAKTAGAAADKAKEVVKGK